MKIDTEFHFYTESFVDYMRDRSDPPKQKVEADGVRVWFEPTVPSLSQSHSEGLENALLIDPDSRVKAMDQAGIDIAIFSVSGPATEQLPPDEGTPVAQEINDTLSKAISKYPDRFAGFATLAPLAPEEAADELERCVTELGFKGACIRSHIGDVMLDDRRFWPILKMAADLQVPIYLHPTIPHRNMIEPLLGYGWALPGPGLGFGIETAISAMRLILSGVFDEYPDLQIILGHFGEALPFWMYRLDFDFNRPWLSRRHRPDIAMPPSMYLSRNFYITCSGNLHNPALLAALAQVGPTRLMFASDYPWGDMEEHVEFIDAAPIADVDREAIYHGNARDLFGF